MRAPKSLGCLLVAGFVLTGMASAAHAADMGSSGLYGSLRIGPAFIEDMNFSEASTADLGLDAKTGWVVGGALGYRMFGNIRVEADLAYTAADLRGTFQQNVQAIVPCGELPGNPCLSPSVDGDIDALTAMGMVYYDFPVMGFVRPYAGLGLGVADLNLDVGTRASMNDGPVSRFDIMDGSDTVMAYRGTVGVSYSVGGADLSVGYTYTFTDRPSFAGQGTLVTFAFDKKMNSHALTAGLTYRF